MSESTIFATAVSLSVALLSWQWCRAAEHVVVESNAPAYELGQTLADAITVSLAANEYLVVISDEGRTLRVRGPFQGPLEDVPPVELDIRDALAELLGGPNASLGALGGIRGPGDGAAAARDTRPSPWLVHAEQSGDQCVISGRRAELWRERGSPVEAFEMTAVATGRSARLSWPASAQRAPWPSSLPPEEQAVYLLRPLDDFRSQAVRVHVLNAALANAEIATVAFMAAKGCTMQARLLLASL